MDNGDLLIMAIAIALMIEGIIPALFPNKWQAYVRKLADEQPSAIRGIGITVFIIGAMLFWLSQ